MVSVQRALPAPWLPGWETLVMTVAVPAATVVSRNRGLLAVVLGKLMKVVAVPASWMGCQVPASVGSSTTVTVCRIVRHTANANGP
jgi:hypothetical protein